MNNKKRDKHLAKAIEGLPSFSPNENLWEEISEGLDEKRQVVKKGRFEFKRLVAAVALIVSIPLITQYFFLEQNDRIHFAEETSVLTTSGDLAAGIEDDFASFLSHECSEYRQVCEMPEFKLLVNQLTEVRAEVVDIDQMIEFTGFDEILYKARSKADKESDRIKKEIVKLLRG